MFTNKLYSRLFVLYFLSRQYLFLYFFSYLYIFSGRAMSVIFQIFYSVNILFKSHCICMAHNRHSNDSSNVFALYLDANSSVPTHIRQQDEGCDGCATVAHIKSFIHSNFKIVVEYFSKCIFLVFDFLMSCYLSSGSATKLFLLCRLKNKMSTAKCRL